MICVKNNYDILMSYMTIWPDNLTVLTHEYLLCTLCIWSFKTGRVSVLGHHTLACFTDITLDGSEILYSPRAYTWLWNIKFQTFKFPLICTYMLEAKQDMYVDTRGVFLNILHISVTCITFVHPGGILYFKYSATNFFVHIQLILMPQNCWIFWEHLSRHGSCFFGYSAHP